MIIHSSLILSGGSIYLFRLFFQYLSPHRYVELQIADCIKLTAKYLKLRGDLWTVTADRKAIIDEAAHENAQLSPTTFLSRYRIG
jgi:hypothetical protein